MLVFTRKAGDEFVIGGLDGGPPLAVVRILNVGNSRVRVGCQAVGDLPVHRREVYEQIKKQHHNKE